MGRLQLRAACGPLATLLFTYLTFAYLSIFLEMLTNAVPQTPTTAAGMVVSVTTQKGHTSASVGQDTLGTVKSVQVNTAYGYHYKMLYFEGRNCTFKQHARQIENHSVLAQLVF